MNTDSRSDSSEKHATVVELHGLATRTPFVHSCMNTIMYSDGHSLLLGQTKVQNEIACGCSASARHRDEAAVQSAKFPYPAHSLNWLTSRNQLPHSISCFTHFKIHKRSCNQIAQFRRIRLCNLRPKYPSNINTRKLLLRKPSAAT